MKKIILALGVLLTLLKTTNAQNMCTQLRDAEQNFAALSLKYFAITSPTAAEQAAYEAECIAYKKSFTAEAANHFITNMPEVLVLKVAVGHLKLLQTQGRYEEAYAESKEAYNNAYRFIDFTENSESSCSTGSGSTITLTKDIFRASASPFLCMAISSAFKMKDPKLACWYFMSGILGDGFKSTAEVNEIAKQVMQYRLKQNLLDDTTFMAAYTYLNSMYAEKSFFQALANIGDFPEDDAIKVITDPMFVNHKMPQVRRGKYAYYPDAAYFQDLYAYLKGQDTANTKLEHAVLKMLLKVYYAHKKAGIDVINFAGTLRCCVASNETGTKTVAAVQRIINAGDKELMQLLAGFIREAYNKSAYYPDLDYGAYLLYHALGDEKLANKMYSRVDKNVRDMYLKL